MSKDASNLVLGVVGRWCRKAGAKLGTLANIVGAFAVLTPEAAELQGKLSNVGRELYEIADKLDPAPAQ